MELQIFPLDCWVARRKQATLLVWHLPMLGSVCSSLGSLLGAPHPSAVYIRPLRALPLHIHSSEADRSCSSSSSTSVLVRVNPKTFSMGKERSAASLALCFQGPLCVLKINFHLALGSVLPFCWGTATREAGVLFLARASVLTWFSMSTLSPSLLMDPG